MSSPSPPAAPSPPSPSADTASPGGSVPRAIVRRSGRGTLYTVIGAVVIVAILVGAGYATGWYGLAPKAKQSVTLQGAGASFLLSLISQWQVQFAASNPNKVSYNPSGAGAGITAFTQKLVNFAATDEPLTTSQAAGLPGTTLTLPVTGGPVVVVYNIPGFTGTLDLNATQIIAIYSGDVTNWGASALVASNAGLSGLDVPIVPVVRLDAAGTTYVLTNFLSDDNLTWSTTVGTSIQPTWPSVANEVSEKGNSALATYVAGRSGAIGYVDLPDANAKHLPLAGIQNPKGDYIVPNVANTQSAINDLAGQPLPPSTGDWSAVSWVNAPGTTDYPLATLSYFLVLQDPGIGYAPSLASAQALVQWLSWTVTSGQAYAGPLQYDGPPTALLTQDISALCTINYNGALVESCS